MVSNLMKTLAISACLVALWPIADAAAQAMLRDRVTVTNDVVTIADLFDNAGDLAATPLYRSPDLGDRGTVPAADVIAAARAAGLADAESGPVREVTVNRASQPVTADDITRQITDALARRMDLPADTDLQVTFQRPPGTYHARQSAHIPARIFRLVLSPVSNRFEVDIAIDQGGTNKTIQFRGTAVVTTKVAVLTRPLSRDEVVAAKDVAIRSVPHNKIRGAVIRDADAVIGLAAQRFVRQGVPLSATEFAPPMLVARGAMVKITYQVGGLSIVAIGRAQEAGAMDQVVDVINLRSKRVIQARVIGQNRVRAGFSRDKVALAGRTGQ